MRRKSERQSSRKTKASPEKKIEKPKRIRISKRKKGSSSSENDSGEEGQTSKVDIPEQAEKKSPTKVQTPTKEEVAGAGDQVWQVKTEGSSDSGEIQKLKLCLTRPSSTPERPDRSPRSKRKSSRTTSSSDTSDFVEEKKKTRHRSKRLDKDSDILDDETEKQMEETDASDNRHSESSKTETPCDSDLPMSTSKNEGENEQKDIVEVSTSSKESDIQDTEVSESKSSELENKSSENKTETITSDFIETNEPTKESTTVVEKVENKAEPPVQETKIETTDMTSELQDSNAQQNSSTENKADSKESCTEYKEDRESNKCETDSMTQESECDVNKAETDQTDKQEETKEISDNVIETFASNEKSGDKSIQQEIPRVEVKLDIETSETDHLNIHVASEAGSSDPIVDKENAEVHLTDDHIENKSEHSQDIKCNKEYCESVNTEIKGCENPSVSDNIKEPEQLASNDSGNQNGQLSLPVMNRKRRWGARPNKIATQKSVSISTDILKDIIPDVKPVEFDEVIEEKKQHKRIETVEKVERPILPKIVIDNTEHIEHKKDGFEMEKENHVTKEILPLANRKISIIKDNDSIITRPPSPPRHKTSNVLFITNLVRPFTLPQLKNLLQRTGKIVEGGFWIDKIKSKCYVKYETEDQAVETRHALHGVTWPVSNPKTLHVDFSTEEAFDKAREIEETSTVPTSMPGTVEDWLREQDLKRERGEADETRPWEKRNTVREWDMGKGVVDKQREREKEQRGRRDERVPDRRRHRTPDRSPEPAKKFKKKEEEAPAKMLDDLFRKTKTTPCIYWLPLSAEMKGVSESWHMEKHNLSTSLRDRREIAIKEEQRRQHMAEHERRMQELRHARVHRRR